MLVGGGYVGRFGCCVAGAPYVYAGGCGMVEGGGLLPELTEGLDPY